MLLSFSVENFRSIMGRQTLAMTASALEGCHSATSVVLPGVENGVLPCAVIYGANASGKSNLLHAFMHMRNMVLRSNADAQSARKLKFTPFRLHDSALSQNTKFECVFEAHGVRYDYAFEYSAERIVSETLDAFPEGRRRKLFVRSGLDVDFGSDLRASRKVFLPFLKEASLLLSVILQSDRKELDPVRVFFDEISGSNQIDVNTPQIAMSLSTEGVDKRVIQFLDMVGTGVCDLRVAEVEIPETRRKWMENVIKAVADSSEVDFPDEFEVPGMDRKVEFGHRSSANDLVFLGADLESAGTRRLLLLMSGIFEVIDSGCVAVIDEIDASLHTAAVKAIVQLFTDARVNKRGAQLIASTHDTNMMDTKLLRRDEIWFAEKNAMGGSEYYSLAEIKRRRDEAFEKAYLDGRYGAAPQAFDPSVFIDVG